MGPPFWWGRGRLARLDVQGEITGNGVESIYVLRNILQKMQNVLPETSAATGNLLPPLPPPHPGV